ncbi:hypothetical protein ACFYPC_23305 [Streptomyces sp. NPDC005808]|uniref:hypothetical protein n=1 Tax=Streptomyces sp. NPDC005808 TaxID=3364734 RepID=UPI0036A3164A
MHRMNCQSGNIVNLAHYWQSLPAESPLRDTYKPPSEPDAKVWMALLAVLAGIAFTASGEVLLGLLVAVGGLVWGAVVQAAAARYRMSLAKWNAAHICLTCTDRF